MYMYIHNSNVYTHYTHTVHVHVYSNVYTHYTHTVHVEGDINIIRTVINIIMLCGCGQGVWPIANDTPLSGRTRGSTQDGGNSK